MRRNLLMALGAISLALAVPSAALAHQGRGHHHHHKAKAKALHAKFRIVHIGATTTTPASTPASTPTTSPTTPTTPPENAGTVASYTGGVLTLTLNGGSTVSGKVTEDTQIECVKATPTTPSTGTGPQPTDQSPGDDNGQGDDQSQGDTNLNQQGGQDQQGGQGTGDDESQQGDHGDNGDDEGENQSAPEPPCGSSALVPGALVRAAELRIGPGGTEFESILLVR